MNGDCFEGDHYGYHKNGYALKKVHGLNREQRLAREGINYNSDSDDDDTPTANNLEIHHETNTACNYYAGT